MSSMTVANAEPNPRQFDVSAADFADQPQPEPVLWRDDGGSDSSEHRDAVLSVGEVAILSSAGGIGKSTVTLQVASAAVTAAAEKKPFGAACGLRVAPGPVYLISYEDSPVRIAHRLKWMNNDTVPSAIRLWPDPEPVWAAAADSHVPRQFADWTELWRAVHSTGAHLVIIDPVSAAFADVSTTETSPVRAFLRALTREAAPADTDGWSGCGVLLVAHDTKAARSATERGENPAAGVVSGSAAWYDGARGVLSLALDLVPGSNDRLLECVKANYGRTGWGARLRELRSECGAYRGFELADHLDRAALENPARPSGRKPRGGEAGQTTTYPPGHIANDGEPT